ncbi:MAG: SseB family protein [Deltaproteobacteria bacterium]|nr:SseB family protein [Deltaproteobacteria bacterium]
MDDSQDIAPAAPLTTALDLAAAGGKDELLAFLQVLLDADVFVPLRPEKEDGAMTVPLIGTGAVGETRFATTRIGDTETLPIFSEEAFVETWAEREWPSERLSIKSLFQLLGESTWCHLNPGQEIGKEISPWEIELLRNGGVEAFGEVIEEIASRENIEVEVETDGSLYPELKAQLRAVLESYPNIQEGFLIQLRDPASGSFSPLLGIKHSGFDEEKWLLFRTEVTELAHSHLPLGESLGVADDLSAKGPFGRLFDDATPFYFAQVELPEVEADDEEPTSFLKTVFGRKGAKSDG